MKLCLRYRLSLMSGLESGTSRYRKYNMIKFSILFLIVAFGSVHCYPKDIFIPCKKNDDTCIANSAKYALKKVYAGIPELNVESTDPLYLDEISGEISTLKYTFTDVVINGFINCEILNVKLHLDEPIWRANVSCPNVVLKGKYKISGQLLILPVEGEGSSFVEMKKYLLGIVAEPKIIESKNGQKHIMIKKYQVWGEAQDGVNYDLQNLFGGRKDLSDAFLKFANENWKEVAEFVQKPLVDKTARKIVTNVNKFLKAVPLEDLYLA